MTRVFTNRVKFNPHFLASMSPYAFMFLAFSLFFCTLRYVAMTCHVRCEKVMAWQWWWKRVETERRKRASACSRYKRQDRTSHLLFPHTSFYPFPFTSLSNLTHSRNKTRCAIQAPGKSNHHQHYLFHLFLFLHSLTFLVALSLLSSVKQSSFPWLITTHAWTPFLVFFFSSFVFITKTYCYSRIVSKLLSTDRRALSVFSPIVRPPRPGSAGPQPTPTMNASHDWNQKILGSIGSDASLEQGKGQQAGPL